MANSDTLFEPDMGRPLSITAVSEILAILISVILHFS